MKCENSGEEIVRWESDSGLTGTGCEDLFCLDCVKIDMVPMTYNLYSGTKLKGGKGKW